METGIFVESVSLDGTELGKLQTPSCTAGEGKGKNDGTLFTIHTKNSTYQFVADGYGYVLHLYYGKRLPSRAGVGAALGAAGATKQAGTPFVEPVETNKADSTKQAGTALGGASLGTSNPARGAGGNALFLLCPKDRGFSGNPHRVGKNRAYSLDTLPQEFPVSGNGDFRTPAFEVSYEDTSWGCDLRYTGCSVREGKYTLAGLPAVWDAGTGAAQTLEVRLADPVTGLEATLLYGVLPENDIITRAVLVKNGGDRTVTLQKVQSASLDFVAGDYDLISFYGRWAQERNPERAPITHAGLSVGSRRGTSSLHYNPAILVAEHTATETSGAAYGLNFVWSGNFLATAQKDQIYQTRVQMGLGDGLFAYPLEPGEEFTAPEVIMTYSGAGLGGVSRNLHHTIRENVCRGPWRDIRRPVLVNSWEAAYFQFTGETIVKLAEEAAPLGIEMLVMDDGWFGKRDNDESGLGDWRVNEKKLGMSLRELSGRVHKAGLLFGIWFEPEMVSEDSDLYRAHPDWALCFPGREPVRSRHQLVLDFSRKEVRDAIFDQMCAVLDGVAGGAESAVFVEPVETSAQSNSRPAAVEPPTQSSPRPAAFQVPATPSIDYIKWDMNRALADVFSSGAAHQGRVMYDYVRGVYEVLDRLETRYPALLIEGCSSGGGRFDAGMLYYTPQIWCSDNTDAIDRTRIQYGTSFCYPACAMGSHVSICPNHQTGRTVPIETRGVVAMSGTFGYELNIAQLTAAEKEAVRAQVAAYKRYAPLIMRGDYYRLTNPYTEELAAWSMVAPDKSEFLLNYVLLEMHGNMPVPYIRLSGLDETALYRETESGATYPAAVLEEVGFPLVTPAGQYTARTLHFTRETSL